MVQSTTSIEVHVEIRDTLDQHREVWDHLVDLQPVPSHCLKSWWLEATVEGNPVYVLVFEGNDLLGGVPLERDTWRGLSRFRTMGERLWPCHFDLVADPRRGTAVTTAIAAWIRRQSPALFHLKGLEPGSRLAAAFPSPTILKEEEPSYSTELRGSLDAYLAEKSGSFRRDLKRNRKRVSDAGYTPLLTPLEEATEALECLREIHRRQFGSQSALLPVFDAFERAAQAGIERGEVEILQIRDAAGVPRAIEVWTTAGDRVEAFAHGQHPDAVDGAGNALLAFGIETFSARGKTSLDLGSHHGEWKRRWAPIETRCLTLTSAVGGRARQLHVARNLANASRRWMRRLRRR
jgi:CelD/BcsL family acetyltransferase involved in cellulose biosynthesis